MPVSFSVPVDVHVVIPSPSGARRNIADAGSAFERAPPSKTSGFELRPRRENNMRAAPGSRTCTRAYWSTYVGLYPARYAGDRYSAFDPALTIDLKLDPKLVSDPHLTLLPFHNELPQPRAGRLCHARPPRPLVQRTRELTQDGILHRPVSRQDDTDSRVAHRKQRKPSKGYRKFTRAWHTAR